MNKKYSIIDEFDKVINKTKWIDSEDYYEIEPFLRQAEIEIERQTIKEERERLGAKYFNDPTYFDEKD